MNRGIKIMNKLAVYPFDYHSRELACYSELITTNYQISALIIKDKFNTPSIINVDESLLTYDYVEAIINADVLLLVDDLTQDFGKHYLRMIECAQENSTKIMFTRKLWEGLSSFEKIRELPEDRFTILENTVDNSCVKLKNMNTLLKIDIPIITVMGMGDYCNKFQCELELRKFFMEKGYQLLQLGSKAIAPIFGFKELPLFVMDKSLTFIERVIKFNRYIVDEIKKNPVDLIVVGIPDSILPYNNNIINGLGETSLIITAALNIDASILCIYNQNTIDSRYIEHLEACSKYRFNTPVSFINVSGTVAMQQDDPYSLNFWHVGKPLFSLEKINEQFDETKLFSISDLDSRNKLMEMIYKNFTDAIDVF